MRAIQVVITNESENYGITDYVQKLEDTWMGEDAADGAIYRAMQDEYGRCNSRVYVDRDGEARPVGWFFVKRQRYEDTHDPYLQGAWVTVGEYHPAIPEHVEV